MNNNVVLPETTTPISDDASAMEVIITSIMNAVAARAASAKDENEDIQSFPSMIRKETCFVQHRQDDFLVSTSGQLIELVKDSVDIVQERDYSGADHQQVYVLRVMLSDSYICRVANIRLRDVPDAYFNMAYGKPYRDGVVIRCFKNRHPGKPSIKKMLCVDLQPVWTDKGIDEKGPEVYAKYHCITVKINKNDLTFLGWIPGIDVKTGLCSRLEDMFVSLGDRDPSMDPEEKEKTYQQRPQKPKLTFKNFRR